MTDKELLEAAARAAGIKGEWDDGCPGFVTSFNKGTMQFTLFDPLTDDGDALRLAVKLKMDVKQWESNSIAVAVWDKHATEDATQDRYNATRRAIVRAAAAIGSSHNAESNGGESHPTRTPC